MAASPLSEAIGERWPPGERWFSVEESAQVVGQCLRRDVSIVARARHRAEDNRFEVNWHGWIDLARGDRLFVDDLPDEHLAVFAGVRLGLREQFVERHAERIDVGP